MKTWFNGDSEGKIKRGTSNRKGTLSDELSKADHIGRQLRYNESESNQFQEQEPKIQEVKPAIAKVEVEKNKPEEEEAKQKRSAIQMSSPFPPRRQKKEEAIQTIEEPKPIQMSSPFPPRRQAVEEVAKKVEKPEETPFGTAPFPARIQPGVPTKENTTWRPQPVTPEHKIQFPKDKQEMPASPREVAKEIVKAAPKTLEVEIPSPFSPTTYDTPKPVQNFNLGSVSSLGEMKDYSYSDSYSDGYEEKFEENYDEPYGNTYEAPYEEYASTYEEESHHTLGFMGTQEVEKVQVEEKPVLRQTPVEAPTKVAPQPIQRDNKPVDSKPSINLKSNIIISFDKDHTMDLNMNIGSVITILNSSGEKFDFKITNDGEGGQNLNIVAPSHTIYQILALFE
nr:hypothetical protein [uncultured Niameybacter sp.]